MNKIILISSLFTLTAWAHHNQPSHPAGEHQCIAYGVVNRSSYDPGHGWQSFPEGEYYYGDSFASLEDAQNSAMNVCENQADFGCRIDSCD